MKTPTPYMVKRDLPGRKGIMIKGLRRRSARLLLLLALGAVTCLSSGSALALPPTDPIEPPPIDDTAEPFTPPANGFDWIAESRFGLDRNGDRIIDYHWRDDSWPVEAERNTYDPQFVHSGFRIHFDGCPTEEERAAATARPPRHTVNTYEWQLPSTTYLQQDCQLTHSFPAEGTYSVTLTIIGPDDAGVGGPYTQDVTVKDFLIVSIGDSYASGEGSPDVYQDVRTDLFGVRRTNHPPKWVDKRCHRSAHAGAAQAALSLEAADPKTSVTFLSFACSGATIDTPFWDGGDPLDPYVPGNPEKPHGTGVLGPYRGPEPRFPEYGTLNAVPSQIKQVADAVRNPDTGSNRTVDALFMSGGGNDAGFVPILTVCLLFKNCMDHDVFIGHDQNGAPAKVSLRHRASNDIATLTDKYDRLAACLRPTGRPCIVLTHHLDVPQTNIELQPLNPTNIYVSQYPDQTSKNGRGQTCESILDDVIPMPAAAAGAVLAGSLTSLLGPFGNPFLALAGVPSGLPLTLYLFANHIPFELGGDEVDWAKNTVRENLNQTIEAAAVRHGWDQLKFENQFLGHGYCASDNWIRTAEESQLVQGPIGGLLGLGLPRNETTGTMHPTIAGYRAYKDLMVHQLREDLYPASIAPGPAPTFGSTDANGSTNSRVGANGWLTGRCPSGQPCVSDYAALTVEAADDNGIRGVEVSVNGADGCSAQASCTPETEVVEEVVDGVTRTKIIRYRWPFQINADGAYRLDFSAGGRDGQVATFTREVRVDLHDPTEATATPSSSPGESGWHRGPVEVTLNGADAAGGSGIATIDYQLDGGAVVSTPPGTAFEVTENGVHTITYRAVDLAGRMGPQQTLTLKIDTSAPTIECVAADGAWHANDVSLGCTAGDADSGLGQPGDDAFTLATSIPAGTETGDAATGTREVCDVAGNCATAGPIGGNKIDKKIPAISITAPTATAYSLNQAVAAGYTCEDGGSGVGTCTGPVASGTNFDTASVGAKTFTVNATDAVGNSAGASVAYQVNYVFTGFFFPVANPPALNADRGGWIVPIRFSLAGNQGLDVLATGYPKSAPVSCTAPGSVDGTEPTLMPVGISIVYLGLFNQYRYAWQTKTVWRGTCRQFVLKLKDGTVYRANFRFS